MSLDILLGSPSDATIASAVNATASAIVTGRPFFRQLVVGVHVSANAAPAATVLFTIQDNVDGLLDQFYVPAGAFTPIAINYNNHPLRGSVGGTITAALPALGVGVTGSVSLRTITIPG